MSRSVIFGFAMAMALGAPAAAQEQPRLEEYELKAIFISNFLKYVEWPDSAFADADSPIVVGISTMALGLGIVVRIKEAYGSIEEHEIRKQDAP